MKNTLLIFILLSIVQIECMAQQFEQRHRIVFYNTENFFDPSDNPATDDDDYTPKGSRHWGYGRMKQKYMNLAKVITAAGEGNIPTLVGLAEVENDSCIYRLLHNTPLADYRYSWVITQSQDRRGINIALLYQPDDFKMLGWESWQVLMPDGTKPTRDILHVWGRMVGGNIVDVIVCHLPSRLGGVKKSAPARKAAHDRLFVAIDSLRNNRSDLHLVVMGDMNDMPRDIKFPKTLGMVNLMQSLQKDLRQGKIPYGSHKYQGVWGFLDQMWVNKDMVLSDDSCSRVFVSEPAPVAFHFMLTEDNTHLGYRPLRSFFGYNYEAGFSDHLPVKVDLHIKY